MCWKWVFGVQKTLNIHKDDKHSNKSRRIFNNWSRGKNIKRCRIWEWTLWEKMSKSRFLGECETLTWHNNGGNRDKGLLKEAKNVSTQRGCGDVLSQWSCFVSALRETLRSVFPTALRRLQVRPRLEFLCSPEMGTVRGEELPSSPAAPGDKNTVAAPYTVLKSVPPPGEFCWALGHLAASEILRGDIKNEIPSRENRKTLLFLIQLQQN